MKSKTFEKLFGGVVAIAIVGCLSGMIYSALQSPASRIKSMCVGGYQHTYNTYTGQTQQVFSSLGTGVPCGKAS